MTSYLSQHVFYWVSWYKEWFDLVWEQHPVALSGLAFSTGRLSSPGLLQTPPSFQAGSCCLSVLYCECDTSATNGWTAGMWHLHLKLKPCFITSPLDLICCFLILFGLLVIIELPSLLFSVICFSHFTSSVQLLSAAGLLTSVSHCPIIIRLGTTQSRYSAVLGCKLSITVVIQMEFKDCWANRKNEPVMRTGFWALLCTPPLFFGSSPYPAAKKRNLVFSGLSFVILTEGGWRLCRQCVWCQRTSTVGHRGKISVGNCSALAEAVLGNYAANYSLVFVNKQSFI